MQQLQKLSSASTWMCVVHPRYDIFSTQALRLSTSASPLTDKDGSSDSPVEESSASSGEEVVEPVIQGKHEDASGKSGEELTGKPESSVKGEEDQSAKPNKEEEEEAITRSIALIEALIAEKEGQLDDLRERAVSSKAELDSVRTRLQRESDNSKKFAIQVLFFLEIQGIHCFTLREKLGGGNAPDFFFTSPDTLGQPTKEQFFVLFEQ